MVLGYFYYLFNESFTPTMAAKLKQTCQTQLRALTCFSAKGHQTAWGRTELFAKMKENH